MPAEIKPDLSCVPFSRKTLYSILTTPFLVILLLVLIYLWTFSCWLSLLFLLLFLAVCYFQTYCCAYQECPYVGQFCPAIVGIMPASFMTKFIYRRKKIVKSKKRYWINIALATMAWLGLVFFPLFWIAKLHDALAWGYIALHLIYYLIFGLTICPVCAIRNTCPGGKLQKALLKRL